MNKPSKSKAEPYMVVDKFGEGQTVAEYHELSAATEAARNINHLTGHRTAVYVGDLILRSFGGRE